MPDCIQEPELSQFIQGKLSESRADEISSHIDECEPCQDTVTAMSGDDTFVDGLRKPRDPAAELLEPSEPAFRHGLQRILSGMQRRSSAASNEQLAPRRIGPYVIEAKLGDGGMGTVFRAQHSKLKRTVALKVLPSHRWSNAQAIARFEREMEAIGQLDHPHIVRASDAGEADGMHYLVMEYVDGLDLARLAKRLGRLPVADACELARQAAVGLQNAHDHGLVHRDIKPSNLMLAWERSGGFTSDAKPTLKILDLGLALLGDEHLREEHDVTTVGALMGTLDYMSPEQGVDSHSVDHRADIYGLGATLFKLLAGRAPYADPQYSTLMKKMTALATKAAPSLGQVRPDLPSSVVQVVDKMLARDPDRRFASSREVAAALAEPAKTADLGALLRTGIATEDPQTTAPTHSLMRLNQATPTQPLAGRAGQGGWKKWLIAAAFGGVLFAAGAVYRIATDYGEIIVTSKSGDLEVVVKQQGETIDRIEMESGRGRTRVRSGKYEIEVVGDDAELVIQPTAVDVQRNSAVMIPLRSAPNVAGSAEAISADELTNRTPTFDGQPATNPLYRVRPGDTLAIFIPGVFANDGAAPPTQVDEAGRPVAVGYPIQVREDGSITLPYVDSQNVAGKSIPDIEAVLRKAYTLDHKILEDNSTILVSIARKADLAADSLASYAKSTAVPRYEGRTLRQWLNDVKFERSPKRLIEAMQAVAAMLDHPANAALVDESLDAIIGLIRQRGKHPTQGDSLSEHAWVNLLRMPQDRVADGLFQEISQGTPQSRQFLNFLWQATFHHNFVVSNEMIASEQALRTEMANRAEEIAAAISGLGNTDVEWQVNFLFLMQILTEQDLAGNAAAIEVYRRGLQLESTVLVAKALRQLAFVAPETPQLTERAKRILTDETFDYIGKYLALQAIEKLGPQPHVMQSIANLLDSNELRIDQQYSSPWHQFSEPLPDWNSIVSDGGMGGMGGMGGGLGGGVISGGRMSGEAQVGNLLRTILRILPQYGDQATTVLPHLIGYLNEPGLNEAAVKKTILAIDPSLNNVALRILEWPENSNSIQQGRAYNLFRDPINREVDDQNAIGIRSEVHDYALLDHARLFPALFLPIQKQLGTPIEIRLNKGHYLIFSPENKTKLNVVWPTSNMQGGARFFADCMRHIREQLTKDSAGSTIDLQSFVEIDDARRANRPQNMGGGMGGGMF